MRRRTLLALSALGIVRAQNQTKDPNRTGYAHDMLWFNEPKNPPQPGVTHHGYHSKLMDKEIGYNLWLPPNYESSKRRYPVVYWLHGRNNTESSDQIPINYLAEGIADGTLPPMIVIFASGGSQSNWCDSYDGKYLAESTFTKELLPYIDSHYRTIASRDGRSIQGMSMGGFGCMRLGLKYPDLFSSIVAFAGGFRRPEDIGAGGPSYIEMFKGDPEIFRKQHAWTIARENAGNIRGRVAIQMYVGDKDPGIENNRHMHQVLEEMKIPHGYREFDGIAHNLKGMVVQLKAENFTFAAKAFKLPPSGSGSSR